GSIVALRAAAHERQSEKSPTEMADRRRKSEGRRAAFPRLLGDLHGQGIPESRRTDRSQLTTRSRDGARPPAPPRARRVIKGKRRRRARSRGVAEQRRGAADGGDVVRRSGSVAR